MIQNTRENWMKSFLGCILKFCFSYLWSLLISTFLLMDGTLQGQIVPHNFPGLLIVFEGLDGSGKTTQMELLKTALEKKGFKVVVTRWNSSPLVSNTIRQGKKTRFMTGRTFSLLHAADLSDRLDHVILPAIREGAIVLSDRWFFTAFARDSVRGMDPSWLRELYHFAPLPDFAFYFRVPIDLSIARVLNRSKGLALSEDHEESHDRPHVKYYEGGLDLHLSSDPVENFKLFQTSVLAEYEKMIPEFGLIPVSANLGISQLHEQVLAIVMKKLQSKDSFKKNSTTNVMGSIFDKDPTLDAPEIRSHYLHSKRGLHFYFRDMLLPMQERFAQLMDMRMPRVLLHGSPHVDNYSKSQQGAAMVDFDRSRIGPYAWDILRLLVSVSLLQKNPSDGLLKPAVLEAFREGYSKGFKNPEIGFAEMMILQDIEPDPDERTTNAYLHANKKWASEMRKNPIPVDDADMLAVLNSYLQSCKEKGLLEGYFVEEAGRGYGSKGRSRYLIVLAPRQKDTKEDRIFLEIKHVRDDPDSQWYKNPYKHHGERMIAASEFYAPHWDKRMGYATYKEQQFWGHQIPTQNVKKKGLLSKEEQIDFLYAVGTQLGRAHRLSLQDETRPEDLEKDLNSRFNQIVESGMTIKGEIIVAYRRYLDILHSCGLDLRSSEVIDE